MMLHNRLSLALLCATGALAALSGCGGTGGTSATPALARPPVAPTSSPGLGVKANAVLVITIPPKTSTSSASRKPSYVSPSTQSIAVQVDAGTPVTQNLTAGSPNCSVPAPLAPLTCTVPIVAAAGTHTFTFTTFDQTGGAGSVLSVNSVTQTLTANQVDTINVTLAGVPKSLLVMPLYNATGISGDQTNGLSWYYGVPQTVSVTAMDADGNLIVGPGAPSLSVSVTGAAAGSGIAVAPASNGNPNDFTLQSTSVGNATLAITATPASGLGGSPLSATVKLATTTRTVTFAGNVAFAGYLDGTGTAAKFSAYVNGITYDPANGNLYVTDTGNCAVRQITSAGVVNTIAGSYPGVSCNFTDGTGTSARFYSPTGIAYDSADGNLYVTDTANCRIRKVTTSGVVTSFAGTLTCGNANGTGLTASFSDPEGIAYDPANGDFYVTDTGNCEIRQITSGGVVTTIAGSAATCNSGSPNSVDGTGSAAQFQTPEHIAYDSANGNLYITDYGNCEIRQMTAAGVVTTLAGNSATCPGALDGTGSAAAFDYPAGITYDSADGNLYVTDSSNYAIRQVTPAGVVTTVAGILGVGKHGCLGVGTGPYCLDGLNYQVRYDQPTGLVYDPANGDLYVTDTRNNAIRQVQL